jgi:hypothetical protein
LRVMRTGRNSLAWRLLLRTKLAELTEPDIGAVILVTFGEFSRI